MQNVGRRKAFDESRRAFYRTPARSSRAAFQRDDELFQYALEVQTLDPSPVLNAVCREGWELVTASFVSVGQEAHRDKDHPRARMALSQSERPATTCSDAARRAAENRPILSSPWWALASRRVKPSRPVVTPSRHLRGDAASDNAAMRPTPDRPAQCPLSARVST
jgi:hypothetical protein